MKLKLLAVTFLVISVATVGVGALGTAATASKNPYESPDKVSTNVFKPLINRGLQDPEDIIDGAKNPEMIPDHLAYSAFFRLLSGRRTEEEKRRARSYLRSVLGCDDCDNKQSAKKDHALENTEIDRILAVAEDFGRQVGALDQQAKEIKERYGHSPDSAAKSRLGKLQKQKETVVSTIAASLPTLLGAASAEKVRKHIKERVKHKMKVKMPRSSTRTSVNAA